MSLSQWFLRAHNPYKPQWIWWHFCFREIFYIVNTQVFPWVTILEFLGNSRGLALVAGKVLSLHGGKWCSTRESRFQDSFEGCRWQQSIPLPFFVTFYQLRCFLAACLSCWDWTKRRKPRAWGNHHLLLIVCEWSDNSRLKYCGKQPFCESSLQPCTNTKYFWESAWNRKRFFLEHIFKVSSFYSIYFIFLFSVNGLFSFFFCVYYGDYSSGILIQYIPQLRSGVLLVV